ncbi:MAG: thiamine pyrophosphate-binding protein [Alphaproteobacteria bacterium]|nr:thiamine pyrophosphate-binding protein [Alphaproteobacteria bacterium]
MKVSDYIIKRLEREGVKHIFTVTGGGGMFLIDSLGRSETIQYVPNHHEQACAFAAEAYSRMTQNIGVALITTGPAGTNALTGVGCAWTDSIPLLILSGQAKTEHLIENSGLRQKGFHEVNISKIAEPITKYSVTIKKVDEVLYHVEKALYLAKNGRPGPVWLDIPIDIQSATIDFENSKIFDPSIEFPENTSTNLLPEINKVIELLKTSNRPIILAGHGIKLSKSKDIFLKLIEKLKLPVITTRSAFDVIENDHPYYAGFIGNFGQRAANFALQNSDLFISLGSRLAVTTVGYEPHLFARTAKKIVVDIDPAQLKSSFLNIDIPILSDVKNFIELLHNSCNSKEFPNTENWIKKIYHWKNIFPNVTEDMKNDTNFVSSYYFYDILSDEMKPDDILVWDQGAAYHCAAVAFKLKKNQKAFSNEGFTPMGYGIVASIGASFASPNQEIISVNGDGGIMLNLQELQTIYYYKLPIKIFIFNNDGYTSIKHTQQNFFQGFFVGVDTKSNLSCPNWEKIAYGFQMPFLKINNSVDLKEKLKMALSTKGSIIIEVMLDPLQIIQPRIKSERLPNGKMASKPFEDMFPYLDRELLKNEMIIDLIK